MRVWVLGVEEDEGRRRSRGGGEYLVVKAVKDKHLNQMLRLLDVPRGDFGHAQCAALRGRREGWIRQVACCV